ncbi:purine-cytosine permease family protein [Microbacterium sp.]|uniref:purine-cytosine permease family protein n=1 Tax=Microbacterium sp. TaxID=51671 RepID=UPI003A91F3BB
METHSIDYIPANERHGRVQSLFTIWFASNMQITTVVTGALAVVIGLPLPWAVLAVVIGNVLGATVMALHSAQGPKLGIPQMIQSRAQFGMYGAALPLILVWLMYIGFFASSSVLGGQALTAWTGIPIVWSILIVSAICTVAAIVGYRLIHRMQQVISALAFIGFLLLTIWLGGNPKLPDLWHSGSFTFGTFLLAVAIAATWQITYAPYVADYSRYLPQNTSIASTFWWTYSGSVIGTVWMMVFGAVAAAVAGDAFEGAPVAFVIGLAPHGAQWAFYIVIILGVLGINTLNLYGAFMSAVTTIAAIVKLRIGIASRVWFVLGTAVVGTLVAILGYGNFVENFENFILFLAYFLIPWTAINLVDFYLVRRERYHMASIFDPDGIYGRWNGRALLAYALGILVEIPFMSTSFYTGPMVPLLGGADISWILGLIVSGGVYAALGGAIRKREDAWFAQHPETTTIGVEAA